MTTRFFCRSSSDWTPVKKRHRTCTDTAGALATAAKMTAKPNIRAAGNPIGLIRRRFACRELVAAKFRDKKLSARFVVLKAVASLAQGRYASPWESR